MTRRVLILLLMIAGCRPAARDAAETPPNIVVIFADDLGYGDLSVYGHPTIVTPNLDRLAAQGVKLTSLYVPSPSCSPSRIGLLTGKYPPRTGVVHAMGPEDPNGIKPAEVTMAEALKERGYRTAAFGKWHLGTAPEQMPTANGFDEYYGLLYSNDMMPPWVNTQRPLHLWRGTEPVDEYPVDQSTLTRRYTEEAVRFIRESAGQPFFLYLPHSMPHLPIFPSTEFAGRSAGGKYGDVVEEIDWSVGRVLETLDELGLTDNTLVVFTSDNGPWSNMPARMYDTDLDVIQRWDAGSTGPLRGAKATTWEGGHRVPGIVRFPGRIPAGVVSTELATTLDLYPTLLNLAGAAIPADRTVDGLDLWPLLTTGAKTPHDYFFYCWGYSVEAVRDARWKLRLSAGDDAKPVAELFDLREDPYERFDVSAAHPDVVNRLYGVLQAKAAEIGGNALRISE
ncbi:MAG: sulfatase [Rhodothermales bacterium]